VGLPSNNFADLSVRRHCHRQGGGAASASSISAALACIHGLTASPWFSVGLAGDHWRMQEARDFGVEMARLAESSSRSLSRRIDD
jgi:hypothetical protein